jgi:hypothetical protein
VNGVDLSRASVGQILILSEPEAAMLIAEGWAVAEPSSAADDAPRRSLRRDRESS